MPDHSSIRCGESVDGGGRVELSLRSWRGLIDGICAASVQGGLFRQARTKMRVCRRHSIVPLASVSLTENVIMVAMALWMLFGAYTMTAVM